MTSSGKDHDDPDREPARQQAAGDSPPADRLTTFPLPRLVPWGLAALLALAAMWIATQNATLRVENANLHTERQLAEIAYKTAQNQLAERTLLAENLINNLGSKLRHSEDLARLKVSALASLTSNTRETRAIVIWDPELQAGLLMIEKLPAIDEDQDYQLWVTDSAHPSPVNGGVIHAGADGKVSLAFKPDQPVTQATAFAISLGKKGGALKAGDPMMLVGQ